MDIMLPHLAKITADETLLNNVQNYIEEHKVRF